MGGNGYKTGRSAYTWQHPYSQLARATARGQQMNVRLGRQVHQLHSWYPPTRGHLGVSSGQVTGQGGVNLDDGVFVDAFRDGPDRVVQGMRVIDFRM